MEPTRIDRVAQIGCETSLQGAIWAYYEVHVDPDITNNMEPRTCEGICLGPMGNMQGSYKFLLLSTGKKIIRRKFVEIPVPDKVIKKVNEIGLKDKMQEGLSFKNRNGEEYKFDNDNEYEMASNVNKGRLSPFPDIAAEAPGVLTECKETFGVDKVVQADPTPTDKDRAMLVAKNSGLNSGQPIPK